MNGNFRSPKFVKRYFDLETPLISIVANNAFQSKGDYRFLVDNSSEANPTDWYNAYFEVDFKLVTVANSAAGVVAGTENTNKFCTTTNGQTFVKRIEVECNGECVYTNTKANESSNVLSLLKYTKSYTETVGQDQFFLDTSGTAEPRADDGLYNKGFEERKKLTDAAAINTISIPLNSYSYFAALKNNLHRNPKTKIILELEDDANIVLRGANAAPCKVIITKLRLWCPKIIFNGKGMKLYLSDYLKPKKWVYQREHHESTQTTSVSSFFPD